jgi:hypothetical protein
MLFDPTLDLVPGSLAGQFPKEGITKIAFPLPDHAEKVLE